MGLALDEPNGDDTKHKVDDFEILIAEDIKHYAFGARLDYAVSPYYEGFVINNGNSSC